MKNEILEVKPEIIAEMKRRLTEKSVESEIKEILIADGAKGKISIILTKDILLINFEEQDKDQIKRFMTTGEEIKMFKDATVTKNRTFSAIPILKEV